MKRNDSFSSYHPVINLLYFIFTIGYALAFNHPVCLGIAFIGAVSYMICIRGARVFVKSLKVMVPVIIITALLNPAFSHEGATIITYLPTGNPLTLESVWYGISAAFMFVTVVCWFWNFNYVITSDKLVYLFGKAAPVLSLMLSMTLRLVPDIAAQFKKVYKASLAAGYSVNGKHFVKLRLACHVFSAVVSWALERAITTADSMKSRGYGLPGRTAYSIFRFKKSDMLAGMVFSALGIYILLGALHGGFRFYYYPWVTGELTGLLTCSMYVCYSFLVLFPVAINMWDAIRIKRTLGDFGKEQRD